MGIKIDIAETKIIIYDKRNSIAYHRFMALKYKDFNRFKLQLEAYAALHRKPTFADILTLAYENELIAVSHHNAKV